MTENTPDTEDLYVGPVAGYRYYHGELWEPWLHEGRQLELIREIENPYDTNAISVFWETERLGYVPKTHSEHLAALWHSGVKLHAEVVKLDFDADPRDRLIIKIHRSHGDI